MMQPILLPEYHHKHLLLPLVQAKRPLVVIAQPSKDLNEIMPSQVKTCLGIALNCVKR